MEEYTKLIVHQIIRKRRAVSPILAALLLIGLAIAAGALLFVVVLPMLQSPGGTLTFGSTYKFINTTTTPHYDKAYIPLSNEGGETVTITNIKIEGFNDTDPREVTINFDSFTIPSGQSKIKEYTFNNPVIDATKYTVTVKFKFGDGAEETITSDWIIP